MIIPINIPAPTNNASKFPPQLAKLGTEEVILIELQGSFQVEGDKSGQLAATLRFDGEEGSKPSMIIGHHLLEGKLVNLSKPLALLEKKVAAVSKDDRMLGDEGMDMGCLTSSDDSTACEYDIVAVVKRKILFSKRPMPVIDMANHSSDTNSKASLNGC